MKMKYPLLIIINILNLYNYLDLNFLTLTASSIFCYFLENNKIYVILQADNWFIIE